MKNHSLGLYGGTFDPIHNGHLILARDAMEQIGIERMVFLPAKISPHKLDCPPSEPAARLAVLEACLADEPGFAVDAREIEREGPSFTIDTVRAYREEYPQATLYYLIGEDNLEALHTWKEIDALREIVRFVVLSRGEGPHTHPYETIARRVEISSTEIRKRVASGLSIRYMVPMAAIRLIQRFALYRNV